jgi:malic enzyme
MMMTDLHVREKTMVVVGTGCAGAECVKALRQSGYRGKNSSYHGQQMAHLQPNAYHLLRGRENWL